MKKIAVLASVLLLAACSTNTPATSSPDQVGTMVAATMQALTSVAPAGISVSFNHVSFVIPNGLASGATPEVIPAASEDQAAPWDVAPEHLVFTLDGYTGVDLSQATEPRIYVYPTKAFEEVNPGASLSIPDLRALLASPAAPINVDSAPGVPFYNAGQDLVAKGTALNFQSGGGVRMISHFSQFPGPILQTGQIYHYQGLTATGEYYIIVILPVTSPLQSTGANPSGDGVAFPDYATSSEADMKAYYQAITDKLNASDPSAFSPSLNVLDALIQSIQITP